MGGKSEKLDAIFTHLTSYKVGIFIKHVFSQVLIIYRFSTSKCFLEMYSIQFLCFLRNCHFASFSGLACLKIEKYENIFLFCNVSKACVRVRMCFSESDSKARCEKATSALTQMSQTHEERTDEMKQLQVKNTRHRFWTNTSTICGRHMEIRVKDVSKIYLKEKSGAIKNWTPSV